MLVRINSFIEDIFCSMLKLTFGAMIVVVLMQVVFRNFLQIPLIWTLEFAQLCFSWCIFIGAAVAFRRDAHYHLDIIPASFQTAGSWQRIFALLLSAIVIYVLLVFGVKFTEIGLTRSSLSLGISELWFFLPIPLSAASMVLFLVERIGAELKPSIAKAQHE